MTQENQIASSILKRAVELDTKKRYTESIICYQEGIQILMNILKNMIDSDEKKKLRNSIENYMLRAEKLKDHIETEKKRGSYHEQIVVEENSIGHSYEKVFGRFLDQNVTKIRVDDPYIRLHHQCQNFLRLCELAVKKCGHLTEIALTTVEHNAEQKRWLQLLQNDLISRHKIRLNIQFSTTLHDREIRLDNGWIIKIGRGLDYFKSPENKFSIGTVDLELRKCHETTIDVFHEKNTRRITLKNQ